jgi:ADP-ribose pyrophosphatase YjhB (NUDIX family)
MTLVTQNKQGKRIIVITQRNADHDSGARGFHITTGGAMEIGKDKSPIDAALRETKEECGVRPKELSTNLCRAVVYNPRLSEIGIIFSGSAKITAEEIQSRKHDDENKILFVSTAKNSLKHWLLKQARQTSVDGILGALTIGNDLYGKQWIEESINSLSESLPINGPFLTSKYSVLSSITSIP